MSYFIVKNRAQIQDCKRLNLNPVVDLGGYFEADLIDDGITFFQMAYQEGCREVTCDSMVPQRYIKRLDQLLLQLNRFEGITLTVQDLGIRERIEALQLSIPLHIDLKTGGNNRSVYHFLTALDGVGRITLSRELNRGEIVAYCKTFPGKLRIQVLGPLLLMQTARPLITGVEKQGINTGEQLLMLEPKRPGSYFSLNRGGYSDRFYHAAWIDWRPLKHLLKQYHVEMVIDPRGSTPEQYQQLLFAIEQNRALPESIEVLDTIPEPEPYRNSEQPDGMVIDAIKGGDAILKSDTPLQNGMILTFTRHKDRDVIITLQHLTEIAPGIYRVPWQRGIIGGNKFYCS